MPHTLAALEAGQLNEWRATLLVRETACLSAADRAAVDEELAADTGTFDGAGDRRIIAAARAAAYRRDPRTVTQRAAHAADRTARQPPPGPGHHVLPHRPAARLRRRRRARRPDPARRHPPRRRRPPHPRAAHGRRPGRTHHRHPRRDHRHRNPARHDRPHPPPGRQRTRPPPRLRHRPRRLGPGPPQTSRQPAASTGHEPRHGGRREHGPRRATARRTRDGGTPARRLSAVWLRRLYTAPGTGELIAMDSRARLFPPGLRRFIQARDDTCRTPYCDAPSATWTTSSPGTDGGPTTQANGAGLCEACNHTKETPGWSVRPRPGPRHTLEITTPTGHTYHSTAPTTARDTRTDRSPPAARTQPRTSRDTSHHRRKLRHHAKTLKRARLAVLRRHERAVIPRRLRPKRLGHCEAGCPIGVGAFSRTCREERAAPLRCSGPASAVSVRLLPRPDTAQPRSRLRSTSLLDHSENDPGYRAAGNPAISRAAISWAAVTPDPQ